MPHTHESFQKYNISYTFSYHCCFESFNVLLLMIIIKPAVKWKKFRSLAYFTVTRWLTFHVYLNLFSEGDFRWHSLERKERMNLSSKIFHFRNSTITESAVICPVSMAKILLIFTWYDKSYKWSSMLFVQPIMQMVLD